MTAEQDPQAAPGGWQQALDELERGLQEAARAAAALRRSLAAGAPAQPESESEAALAALRRSLAVTAPAQPESDPKVRELPLPPRPKPEEEPAAQEPPGGGEGVAAFERVWARLEAEKLGKQVDAPTQVSEDAAAKVTSKLLNLPGQFIITVEEREGKVDLVPLHRALTGLPDVEDVSLVSFANGVPVISVRIVGELDHEQLSRAVGMAMDRECEVIPHENGKLFLRLTAHEAEAS